MTNRFFVSLLLVGMVLTLAAQTPADSIALVRAPWKTSVLRGGLVSKTCDFASLYGVPLSIALLEVHSDYKIDVQVNAPVETTSTAARIAGAVAAINGSFFSVKEGFSVCYLQQGCAVIDTTIQPYFRKAISSGAIRIDKGKVKLLPWSKQVEKSWQVDSTSVLVSGPLLLLNSRECDLSPCNPDFVMTRHPRSALAVAKDGTVLLLTVDGRLQGHSEGIRLTELAHLLRVLGVEDAINLDGGASSTLWSASAPDTGILNHPCGNQVFDSGGERKIANIICVYEQQ